jgi:hypothetical protein
MSSHFVQSLRAEIAAIERELERYPLFLKFRRLQDLLPLYEAQDVAAKEGSGPSSEVAANIVHTLRSQQPSPPVRQASDARKSAEAIAREVLRGRTTPTPTRELHQVLVERGIEIGGKNPISNLSAILSKNVDFIAVGRSGWLEADHHSDPARHVENNAKGEVNFDDVEGAELNQPDEIDDEDEV